jgi:ribonuclease HI
VASYGRTIGETTNNRAEYAALVSALQSAQELGGSHLTCHLDSQLVVEQLNGNYRIKDSGMREAAAAAQSLARHFESVRYVTIPREKNIEADALVNEALDRTAAE